METIIGVGSTIFIIAGVAFAFGGALGNSMPVLIFGGVLVEAGLTALIMTTGLSVGWSLAIAAVIVIAAWKLFWKLA